jgi:hypothetical protein
MKMFKEADLFRYDSFKPSDILDKPVVDLLNENMDRQREFYLNQYSTI